LPAATHRPISPSPMLARALPHGWAAQEHKLGIT
jgi:hypothetical protein